jgi:hypothetical protein
VYTLSLHDALPISAYYLLKGRFIPVARRSMTVAAAFGLASSLSVVVLGDESGYALTDNQKMKLAAIEAVWHTEPGPSGLTLVGYPDSVARETRYKVEIPWLLGLIATRSLDGTVTGMSELVLKAQERIASGVIAYDAVQRLKANPQDMGQRARFEAHTRDLGYALLLKRQMADPRAATNPTPDAINDPAVRAELAGKRNLYLIEEPTIGLHIQDVARLIDVLHRLVDEGHTVVVIEHHPDVYAEADYLIDIGPEAGPEGGQLVAAGTPEEVKKNKISRTARFL